MSTVGFGKKMTPLLSSTLFGKTGDFSFEIAFVLIAIDLLDGDIAKIGLVYFCRLIPYLFIAPIGGILADNFSKKNVMIATEIYRSSILVVMVLFALQGEMTIYVLIGLSMLLTVGDSLLQPSFRATIFEQVHRDDIPRANSAVQVVEDTSSIIGPLMSAVIVSVASREIILVVVSVFFVCSALSLMALPKAQKREAVAFRTLGAFNEMFAAVTSLHTKNRELFLLILGTTLSAMFASAALRFVFPVAIVAAYGQESYVGYAYTIIAIGTVCGGLLYTRIVKEPTTSLLMRAWIAYGALFVVIALVLEIDILLTASVLLVLGFAGAIVDITINIAIQFLSEENEVGRNFGLYAAVANTGDAVSGLVAGVFAVLVGAFSLPAMATSIVVAAGSALARLPKRSSS